MFSGLDEAVVKNIDACKQLSQLTKTSMGPNGAYFPDVLFVPSPPPPPRSGAPDRHFLLRGGEGRTLLLQKLRVPASKHG